MNAGPVCRSCGTPLNVRFADLGMSPISNAFPLDTMPRSPETVYPLRAYVCAACKLVQIEDIGTRETHFHDSYAYLSSFSSGWLEHARRFADAAIQRFALGDGSRVIEVASNDGYLLRNFVERGIPCLGIDPAGNAAAAAEAVGVQTVVGFFGRALADQLAATGGTADLMVANNVLAHVPDINDFVAGFSALLKVGGTISFEFPHLLELIRHVEFDTIYHEHYSYLSLHAVVPLLGRHGLAAYDVERLPSHGGSLRLYVGHSAAGFAASDALVDLVAEEEREGLGRIETYAAFDERIKATKRALLQLLIGLKAEGSRIAGYGAPAKGTTLLNYCGIGTDFIDFTVDRNPAKQGRLIPGTGIPVLPPAAIAELKPDYVLVLPWNLKDEILRDLAYIRDWGGKFIIPIPVPVTEG